MPAPPSPTHMYHRSVQTALETGSDLWDVEEASLGTLNSVENIWKWLQGPVIDVIFTDRNARCAVPYRGGDLRYGFLA